MGTVKTKKVFLSAIQHTWVESTHFHPDSGAGQLHLIENTAPPAGWDEPHDIVKHNGSYNTIIVSPFTCSAIYL